MKQFIFFLILVVSTSAFGANTADIMPQDTTPVNTLKTWFSKGKKPTEAQFHSWLDSYRHLSDALGLGDVTGLVDSLVVLRALAEAGGDASVPDSLAAHRTDINNLQTLSGRPDGSLNLGTFSGTTIPDNVVIKPALQALETEIETKLPISDLLDSLLAQDGSGSGLDADLLDGQEGAYYLNLNNNTGDISTTQIENDAVTTAKIASGTANTLLGYDGSGNPGEVTAGTNITISGGQISSSPAITINPNDNYIPKRTSSTTFGNSLIYDNGVNLGIGTTSPAWKFHVEEVDNNSTLKTLHYNAFSRTITSDNPNSTYVYNILGTAAGTFSHQNWINLQSQANVTGSGGTNRVKSVQGRVNVSGSGAADYITLLATHFEGQGTGTINNVYGLKIGDGYGASAFSNPSNSITNTYGVYVGDITSGTQTNVFGFYQDDSNAKNYFNGNTGIGTTTPTANLHINRETGTTYERTAQFRNGSFTNAFFGLSPNTFHLGTSGTTLSFHSGSDMGATGTSIPTSERLRLTDHATFYTSTARFQDGVVGTPSISFANDTNTGIWRPTTDNIAFSTNGSERVRVDAAGNVGIGSSNPSRKLHIEGTSDVYAVLRTSGVSGDVNWSLENSGDATHAWGIGRHNGGAFQIRHSTGAIYPSGTTSTPLWIDISDNIGLGTNSPANKLDVEGGMAVGASYSGSSVAPTNGLIVEGNVGIGTTPPFEKVHVLGGILLGDAIATNNGTIQYNTTSGDLEGRVGGSWVSLTAGASGLQDEGNSGIGVVRMGSNDSQNVAIETNGTDVATFDTQGKLTLSNSVAAATSGNVLSLASSSLPTNNRDIQFTGSGSTLNVIRSKYDGTAGHYGLEFFTANGTLNGSPGLAIRDDNAVELVGRFQMDEGATVASATNMTLGTDGNLFHISGTTTINTITGTGWQPGSQVTLIFDASVTVNDKSTSSGNIALAGSVDWAATDEDVLVLSWDGTTWYQTSRSQN